MTPNPYDEVRSIVMGMVSNDQFRGVALTPEIVRSRIDGVLDMYERMNGTAFVSYIDPEALARDIEASCNVFIAQAGFLGDDEDHVPWLDHARDGIEWKLWERYSTYLSAVEKMPPAAVSGIDSITDEILQRLESPNRPGAWDRRGLVAGQVQSGKTGNYTGLICKAIDSGYKLVIVLAGIHNSLRAQTQARIDDGVLGFNSASAFLSEAAGGSRVGVGLLAGKHPLVNSFTSRKQTGDFSLKVAEQVGVGVGGADAVVLVIKKNKSVLTNVLTWATGIAGVVDPENGRRIVRGVPILVLDDEADQASVDTNGPKRGSNDGEYDPPVINSLVRRILNCFEQSAYVGYTATPFANIFADPDAVHEDAGQSLFPKSFIVSLPAPSNYIGPAKVFGLRTDVGRNLDGVEPLPITRSIADYEAWMPDGHNKLHQPGPMPKSLVDAMHSFVLTCAVRRWRGQTNKHNSMLVHVTRFVDVQTAVRNQVVDELKRIQVHVDMGSAGDDPVWQRLEELFETDYGPTTKELDAREDVEDGPFELPSFALLRRHIEEAVESIHVKLINGKATDALEYVDHPEGVDVIAVGGAKLSRGLTLEGLSVSYYLRGSRMYDTLMQMGRWFGYRPGYLDLCRLYTTDELVRLYSMVTEATTELYLDFDIMVATNSTPREFALQVLQHPDGLMVTSPNRMRAARLVAMSFSQGLSETVVFRPELEVRERNWRAFETLVESLNAIGGGARLAAGMPGAAGSPVWIDASADVVLDFLAGYSAHGDSYKVQPAALRDYVISRTKLAEPELVNWTVLIANNGDASARRTVGNTDLGLTTRSDHKTLGNKTRFAIRRLVNPPHERIDLEPGSDRYEEALRITQDAWRLSPRGMKRLGDPPPDEPNGVSARISRDPSNAILMIYPLDPSQCKSADPESTPFIGFAISFSKSRDDAPREYVVAKDAWKRLVGLDEDAADAEDDDDE